MQGAQPVATDVRRMNFWREELVGRRWVSSCRRSKRWWVLVSGVGRYEIPSGNGSDLSTSDQQMERITVCWWFWWRSYTFLVVMRLFVTLVSFSPQNVCLLPRFVLFQGLGCIYYLRRQSGTSFGRLAVVFSGNILRFFSCSDFHRHLGRDHTYHTNYFIVSMSIHSGVFTESDIRYFLVVHCWCLIAITTTLLTQLCWYNNNQDKM